jgi:DNA-binding transcriptional regulator YdaS (Cro superfamily)
MRKTDVLEYFSNNGAAVARAIGITKSAVSQWGEVIPEAMAYRLERYTEGTKGALTVDPSLYVSETSQRPVAHVAGVR